MDQQQRQRAVLNLSKSIADHVFRNGPAAGLDPVDGFAAIVHAAVEVAVALAATGRANSVNVDLELLERFYAFSDQGWRQMISAVEQKAAERIPQVDLAALFPGIRPQAKP